MAVTKSSTGETYDVGALKDRDPSAFERLVRQESARVFRCIARLVRDEDEAHSLTQETFLQAYRKIDTFRGDAKLTTWLCAIGINLARASLRKSMRYDLLDVEEMQPVFLQNGETAEHYETWNPQRVAEQRELIEIVHRGIDRLPPTYREVIILRDIEELSTADVAQMLEISEGAVRVRVHRARQALRKILDEYLRKT